MFNVPLTSLIYKTPDDGFPLLPSWRMTASDIFFNGYQHLREPMEVKEVERKTNPGQTAAWILCDFSHRAITTCFCNTCGYLFFLTEASLQCTKGLGRLSMLYFGAMWSYLNKDQVQAQEDVKKDFVRCSSLYFLGS